MSSFIFRSSGSNDNGGRPPPAPGREELFMNELQDMLINRETVGEYKQIDAI